MDSKDDGHSDVPEVQVGPMGRSPEASQEVEAGPPGVGALDGPNERSRIMLCSGCGKDVPFIGDVCPYCHRNKSADQKTQIVGLVFALPALSLGWWLFGFWWGVGLMMVAAFVGVALSHPGKPTRPPEVRIAKDDDRGEWPDGWLKK
jgi:hypothetical protein